MTSILEQGGGTFEGIKLLRCEDPLPPIDEAIAAARAEVARSNYYAAGLAGKPRDRDIFGKPLNDSVLGPGFMRVTTALPEDNACVVAVLRELH